MNWIKANVGTGHLNSASEALLTSEIDGAVITLWADYRDGEAIATLTVERGGKGVSTDDTQEWPAVEAVIDRSMWPTQIYKGQGGDKVLQSAMDTFEASMRLDEEGEE